jgi:hypothetical protein
MPSHCQRILVALALVVSGACAAKGGARRFGGGGSGGSGGMGGGGPLDPITARMPDAGVDRPPIPGEAPTAQFVAIHDNVIKLRCGPCHLTQVPRAGNLDLADAPTALASLTRGSTGCASAFPRARVVAGQPDDSYLMKKLVGAAGICGARMPKGCDEPDAGPDHDLLADADARADARAADGPGRHPPAADAAVADALPDAGTDVASADGMVAAGCLAPAAIQALRSWILTGAKIRALAVHDFDRAATWSIESDLQVGTMGAHPWVDYPGTYLVSVDPGATRLLGKSWIKVNAQSKIFAGGPQATITLAAPADVYLVVDDRWSAGAAPAWLGGWTDTTLNFVMYESANRPALPFSLYVKSAPGGDITLPAIGETRAYDYFVVVD